MVGNNLFGNRRRFRCLIGTPNGIPGNGGKGPGINCGYGGGIGAPGNGKPAGGDHRSPSEATVWRGSELPDILTTEVKEIYYWRIITIFFFG